MIFFCNFLSVFAAIKGECRLQARWKVAPNTNTDTNTDTITDTNTDTNADRKSDPTQFQVEGVAAIRRRGIY